MTAVLPRVVRIEDVPPVTWAGDETGRFLLRAEHTGGLFSYYEVTVPAGQGTVLHRHVAMDETFHVVAGEFAITVGDVEHVAGAGTVVFGPRGIAHAFRNCGDGPGTLHCITTPGGIEDFFEQLSELLHQDPPAQWSSLRELAGRHGIVTETPPTATA